MSPEKIDAGLGSPKQPHPAFAIDWKRILYRAFQYWYLIVFSVAASLTIAFFNNRYAIKIFPVTASILIKEKEETS